MEGRLARAGPSRLELGRHRMHVRQLDSHLFWVAGMRFPHVNVGTSTPDFLTRFDSTCPYFDPNPHATPCKGGQDREQKTG